jgi:hypothetical protein
MNNVKRLMGWAYRNSDVFYYFSFLSLVFAKSLGFYSGNTEYRIIMVFSMLCLGIKLVLTKYTVKEIVVMAAIALYAVFIYLKTGYITFTITVVTLLGAKNIDVYDLMKKVLFVRLICMIVLISASTAGIVGNFVKDQYDDGLTYSFGFQNPNDFMVNVFVNVALIFYLNYKKLNVLYFLLSAYAFYAVYCVTKSMTGMMLGVFLLVVFLFLKIFDRLGNVGNKIKQIISAAVVPTSLCCFIGTFIVSAVFDVNNRFMFTLDQLVSGRLKIQHQYWLNYGFSLLGKDISRGAARWDGVQINNGFLDSNYWCSFYKYGFVSVMIFIVFLVAASWYFHKKKDYNVVIIINTLCIYGLMEDFLISSIVNPFLLLAMYAVYSMLEERKRSVKEKRVENACCNNN